MGNIKLKENVIWVGYVDWDVRDFHGYTTDKGSTYNAYLIKDKHNTLIDTVKSPFAAALIKHIEEQVPLENVKYVVCNHAEPDHSGSLPLVVEKCPNIEIVCNQKCQEALEMHYDTKNWKFKIVDESSELVLGETSLKFLNTPMAHWPESMATYLPQYKILFSMDAFGQHYATSGRFDYEENIIDALYEAKKYYANIIMLYGKQVEAVLNRASNIDIEIIAPSHGIIWSKNIPEIIDSYKKWARCKAEKKLIIFYDTMWKSTGMMADQIYEGAMSCGIEVRKYDLKYTNLTVLATEMLDSAGMVVGTPTLNKSLMPKVAEALTYLKGLAPANKYAFAFGSYGWAKKSGQHDALEFLKQMNCRILRDEPIQSQFVPSSEILEDCYIAGKEIGTIIAKSNE